MKDEINTSKRSESIKMTQNKSKERVPNDFEMLAVTFHQCPDSPDGFTMDSTAHQEISIMSNSKFSDEIVKRASQAFNLNKLNKLKTKKFPMFLEEGKRQIKELWSCIESINAHTTMFTVSFLIAIGKILVEIEDGFGKKSDYMKWLKESFGYEHLRYFQHAKQLFKMGDFARMYASLGKNRLIEFDRLQKELKVPYHEILSSHPFEDTTADFDEVLFKEHVDSIITYYRLQTAGIKFTEFDQAALIAAYLRKPINVKDAENINEWLNQFSDVDEQKKSFDFYVLNKGDFPNNGSKPSRRQISLTKYIADLVTYSEEANIDDRQWIEEYKSKIAESELIKVYHFISRLVQNLEINLNQENVPVEVAGEGSTK